MKETMKQPPLVTIEQCVRGWIKPQLIEMHVPSRIEGTESTATEGERYKSNEVK